MCASTGGRLKSGLRVSELDRRFFTAVAKGTRERASQKKGEKMNTERKHHGYIFRRGKSWFGRYRCEELKTQPDGSKLVVRRQRAVKLCQYSDRYRSKKDVQPILNCCARSMKAAVLTKARCLSRSTSTGIFFPIESQIETEYRVRLSWACQNVPRAPAISVPESWVRERVRRRARIRDKDPLIHEISDGRR